MNFPNLTDVQARALRAAWKARRFPVPNHYFTEHQVLRGLTIGTRRVLTERGFVEDKRVMEPDGMIWLYQLTIAGADVASQIRDLHGDESRRKQGHPLPPIPIPSSGASPVTSKVICIILHADMSGAFGVGDTPEESGRAARSSGKRVRETRFIEIDLPDGRELVVKGTPDGVEWTTKPIPDGPAEYLDSPET